MRILVLYFTQSGQLREILQSFMQPLSDYQVDFKEVKPLKAFPFPWTSEVFFDAMPDSVLEKGAPLAPLDEVEGPYDLIVVGHQPWFLSPAIPVTALLQSQDFKRLAKGKPVLTLIGSRNMWVNAQCSVTRMIEAAGGRVVGNVPLVDKANNLISAVTILYWMVTGKKDKMWGIFPLLGVAPEDIKGTADFGRLLKSCLEEQRLEALQADFVATGRLGLSPNILFIEKRGKMMFRIWAGLLVGLAPDSRKRRLGITAFKYYLFFALFLVAPIVLLVYNVLFLPFLFPRFKKKRQQLLMNDFSNL